MTENESKTSMIARVFKELFHHCSYYKQLGFSDTAINEILTIAIDEIVRLRAWGKEL